MTLGAVAIPYFGICVVTSLLVAALMSRRRISQVKKMEYQHYQIHQAFVKGTKSTCSCKPSRREFVQTTAVIASAFIVFTAFVTHFAHRIVTDGLRFAGGDQVEGP